MDWVSAVPAAIDLRGKASNVGGVARPGRRPGLFFHSNSAKRSAWFKALCWSREKQLMIWGNEHG